MVGVSFAGGEEIIIIMGITTIDVVKDVFDENSRLVLSV